MGTRNVREVVENEHAIPLQVGRALIISDTSRHFLLLDLGGLDL
jgi:hypothetical protein